MLPGTRSRWLLLLLAVVVTLTLGFAACGGGDDSDDGGGSGDDTTGSGNNGDAAEDALDFGKLSSSWESIEAKVTYELTTADDVGTTKSTITYYNLPPNNRTDLAQDGELTSFIKQGDSSYICSDQQCLAYASADALNPIPFFSTFAAPEALELYADIAGLDTDGGKEEIAGLSATCYSVEQDGSEIGWCFGDDGILLSSFSEADGTEFEMTAIEVSADVSESDFEPPYDVVEIPTIGDISQ